MLNFLMHPVVAVTILLASACGTGHTTTQPTFRGAVDAHERGDYAKAQKVYKRLAASGEIIPGLGNNQGVLALQQGQYADAIHHLEKAMKVGQSSDRTRINYLYARASEDSTRLEALDEARAIADDSNATKEWLYCAALILANSPADRARAQVVVQKLIGHATPAMNAELYFSLGIVALSQDLFAEAVTAFAESARAKRNPWAHYNRALALRGLRKLTLAMDELVAARLLAPTEPQIPRLHARIAIEAKQWSTAADRLRSLIAQPTPQPVDLSLMGYAFWGMGKYSSAASAFARCVELDAGEAACWYNLGLSRMRLRQWSAAKTAFMKVLESKPLHGAARLHIQRIDRMQAVQRPTE